jgi:hypothetical protein
MILFRNNVVIPIIILYEQFIKLFFVNLVPSLRTLWLNNIRNHKEHKDITQRKQRLLFIISIWLSENNIFFK